MDLTRGGEGSLHEQIEACLREDIRRGRLPAGTRLPSSRGLASALGVSRGVVTEAYGQLASEGYLSVRQGAPVRVASAVRAPGKRPPAVSLLEHHAYDFDPGTPDLSAFPREAWLRSLRGALRGGELEAIGYGDPRGAPRLREALAAYLGRVRSVDADPEHMLICTGFMQGFALLCRTIRNHGIERLALEDPGWHRHKLVAEQAGLEIVPVPVDGEGMRVQALDGAGAEAVVLTAAHQFPTGATLAAERRAALLEWAGEDRVIVEDDYDSELRYDGMSVGALQGLAPERVVFIGSASTRLAPAMRLGWMLMPTWLTWELTAAKAVEDAGSEVIGQLALCDFIERGELDRHVRRMRLIYARRRERLLESLARSLPGCRPVTSAAGLFELVQLPSGVDESAVVRAAAERGVGVQGLALHRFSPGGPPGLLLGYGKLAEPAIEQGVRLLAEALAAVAAGH